MAGKRTFFVIVLLLCGTNTGLTQTLTARRLPEPPRPLWFGKDAPLQSKVEVNVKGVALRVLLDLITAQTKVPLSASARLLDFRVSICSQARPLSEVMLRIQDLFHH